MGIEVTRGGIGVEHASGSPSSRRTSHATHRVLYHEVKDTFSLPQCNGCLRGVKRPDKVSQGHATDCWKASQSVSQSVSELRERVTQPDLCCPEVFTNGTTTNIINSCHTHTHTHTSSSIPAGSFHGLPSEVWQWAGHADSLPLVRSSASGGERLL